MSLACGLLSHAQLARSRTCAEIPADFEQRPEAAFWPGLRPHAVCQRYAAPVANQIIMWRSMLNMLCCGAGAPADTLVVLVADASGCRQPREQCWAHEALSGARGLQDRLRDARARLCWVHTGAAPATSPQQLGSARVLNRPACWLCIASPRRMLAQVSSLMSRTWLPPSGLMPALCYPVASLPVYTYSVNPTRSRIPSLQRPLALQEGVQWGSSPQLGHGGGHGVIRRPARLRLASLGGRRQQLRRSGQRLAGQQRSVAFATR